jgi:hypothetical protein
VYEEGGAAGTALRGVPSGPTGARRQTKRVLIDAGIRVWLAGLICVEVAFHAKGIRDELISHWVDVVSRLGREKCLR